MNFFKPKLNISQNDNSQRLNRLDNIPYSKQKNIPKEVRTHQRMVYTPMKFKYWIPCLVLTVGTIVFATRNKLKKHERHIEELKAMGYARYTEQGMTKEDKLYYAKLHMERLKKGEDPMAVATELKQDYDNKLEERKKLYDQELRKQQKIRN